MNLRRPYLAAGLAGLGVICRSAPLHAACVNQAEMDQCARLQGINGYRSSCPRCIAPSAGNAGGYDDGASIRAHNARVDAINAHNEAQWQRNQAAQLERAERQANAAIAGGIIQFTNLLGTILGNSGRRGSRSSDDWTRGNPPSANRPSAPVAAPTFGGVVMVKGSAPAASASELAAQKQLDGLKREPTFTPEETAKKLDAGVESARWPASAGETVCRESGSGREGEYSQEDCETLFPEEVVSYERSVLATAGCTCARYEVENKGTTSERLVCAEQKCAEAAPQIAAPKLEPTKVKVGKKELPRNDVAQVVTIVGEKAAVVGKKERETEFLETKLPEFKQLSRIGKGLERDARKKVAEAKTPEEKKQKETMLDEIIAYNKETEAVTAGFEKRREAAKRELKDAKKDLDKTTAQAKDALTDESKLEAFVGGHKVDAKAAPAAAEAIAAGRIEAPCKDECAPSIKIWRPTTDSVDFIIEATRRYGEDSIPYPDSEVTLTWAGYSEDNMTDRAGRLSLDPVFVKEHWPAKAERVSIKAELGGAANVLTVTLSELDHYVEAGAGALAEQGEAALRANRFEEAAARFWKSLSWRPSEKAAAGWVSALERGDKGRAKTLSAYRIALVGRVMDPTTRFQFKQKAVRLARGVKPAPGVSGEAQDYWKRGIATFKTLDMARAIAEEETASSLAPWWAEPYYVMAAVYAHLAVHKSFAFAAPAIDNYELFLAAAPSDDARLAEARKDRDRLKRLQDAMK